MRPSGCRRRRVESKAVGSVGWLGSTVLYAFTLFSIWMQTKLAKIFHRRYWGITYHLQTNNTVTCLIRSIIESHVPSLIEFLLLFNNIARETSTKALQTHNNFSPTKPLVLMPSCVLSTRPWIFNNSKPQEIYHIVLPLPTMERKTLVNWRHLLLLTHRKCQLYTCIRI